MAFHGLPRITKDLDLFLLKSDANESVLLSAFLAFGLPVLPVAISRLMTLDRQMMFLGNEPNAVDLLTFLDGVDFESAWLRREEGELSGAKAFFIGREDYIATKRATGRAKDLRDIEILEGR